MDVAELSIRVGLLIARIFIRIVSLASDGVFSIPGGTIRISWRFPILSSDPANCAAYTPCHCQHTWTNRSTERPHSCATSLAGKSRRFFKLQQINELHFGLGMEI